MNEEKEKTPSFQKINYSLRTAKNIERKMIIEALHRLSFFDPVKNYTYIGFGSTFFTDFSLFHKQMGIDKLYSIELEKDLKSRFEFNKPFHCINIIYKHSNEALKDPMLKWNDRKIIWLDYDYKITADVIIDIDQVVEKCSSGDAFLITLNASSNKIFSEPNAKDKSRLRAFEKFKKQFILKVEEDDLIDYSDLVDGTIQPSDLADWGLANVCTKIINTRIFEKLRDRNEENEDEPLYKKLNYKKIFDFHYQDGAPMMTVGFIFYNDDEQVLYEQCKFNDFDFCSNLPYLIKAPNLTMKEIQYIDSFLPSNLENMSEIGIPDDEIEGYQEVYRYFPAFLEALR